MLQLLPTCEVLVSSRLGSQVYRLSISVLVLGVAIPDRSEHASRKYKDTVALRKKPYQNLWHG